MTEKKYGPHIPILLDQIIKEFDSLDKGEEFLLVDCTFGGGGHSCAFLEHFPKASLIACDQDVEAIKNGRELLESKGFANRSELIHTNFSQLYEAIVEVPLFKKFSSINGVLADLGVSSHQLDDPSRGFSFLREGPLDMRMNQESGQPSAKDVVNSFSQEELADIFFHYGEERLSRRIAQKIIETRQEKELETTKDLEDIVFHCYPKKQRFSKTHPATRVFQAIRIYVNNELDIIPKTIESLFPILDKNALFQILTFHSLEDRLVKRSFRSLEDERLGKRVYKKPIIPSEDEKLHNSRSRSAKLRVLLKN